MEQLANGAIVVERGVPLPTAGRNRGAGLSHAMRSMEVGDSFVVESAKTRNVICSLARTMPPRKFATRVQPDGTFRVWRTA